MLFSLENYSSKLEGKLWHLALNKLLVDVVTYFSATHVSSFFSYDSDPIRKLTQIF